MVNEKSKKKVGKKQSRHKTLVKKKSKRIPIKNKKVKSKAIKKQINSNIKKELIPKQVKVTKNGFFTKLKEKINSLFPKKTNKYPSARITDDEISTRVESLMSLVEKNKDGIKLHRVAKELQLPPKLVEEWAYALNENDKLILEYSVFGTLILKKKVELK